MTRPAWFLIFLCTVGALTGLLGQRHDLARERLAETRRELLRTRLDTDQILQHLTTGVLTVDAEGRVVFLNLAAQQVLELEAAAVHGRPCGEALPQRLAPLRDPLMRTVRTARPETRVEMELERSDGSRLPVGCSTNVLYAQGQANGVVAVFQDLSEVREMERRALRAETLAQVGKLSAGIAHEIRNGLKPISGSVEYLQRELKLEGESERLMALIGRECDRLNRFVSDLLSYSRERELVPEAIELGSALREVCELLRRDPRCGPGVAVAAEGDLRPILVAGDREQLRQVWLNLATNALEAMAGRGRLELRWGSTPRGEAWVEFIDSGAGIEAGDLLRAGEPFFTTKQGGTGLGLAIARRIVERHGGRLDLDSHPDRGTTARVTLPCERAHQALAA